MTETEFDKIDPNPKFALMWDEQQEIYYLEIEGLGRKYLKDSEAEAIIGKYESVEGYSLDESANRR